MKKLLSFLTAGVLCGSLLAALPVSAAETATRKTGDITGDGVLDTDDSVLVLKYYAKSIINEEESVLSMYPKYDFTLATADVNKDGFIDVDDAYFISKYFARACVDNAPDTIEELIASLKK